MSLRLYGLAAAVSLVELDAVCFGQLMISRPLVVGPALGALLGRADIGMLVGSLVELMGIDEAPAGGHLPLNGTVAASSALLMSLGPSRLPLELAFPAGLLLGWTHARGEAVLRQRRAKFCRAVERALEEASQPGLGKLAVWGMAQQACWTALLLAAALAVLAPLLGWGWLRAPQVLRDGLGFGFLLGPALAAAGLLHILWGRRS